MKPITHQQLVLAVPQLRAWQEACILCCSLREGLYSANSWHPPFLLGDAGRHVPAGRMVAGVSEPNKEAPHDPNANWNLRQPPIEQCEKGWR